MNFEKLFQIQKVLNRRIVAEHNLEGVDLFAKVVLALQVELGELANETRCFKYWSLKPPSADEVVLEEYVDVLHFVLSMGLQFDYTDVEVTPIVNEQGLTEQFLQMFALVNRYAVTHERDDYVQLFGHLLGLGRMLGFDTAEIERAYLVKNEENHRRQTVGY